MKSNEKKARRKFTSEFKDQAVKRVLSGHKVSMVAKELGISESLLHTWVTRHRLSEGSGALQAEQAAEIARLKRMLAQKEEEAAILKKAMAYFARESR
jgi:transposase